jgi:hypothetical protein
VLAACCKMEVEMKKAIEAGSIVIPGEQENNPG